MKSLTLPSLLKLNLEFLSPFQISVKVLIYRTGLKKFYSTISVLKFTGYELFKCSNSLSLKMVNRAPARFPYWITDEERKKPSRVHRFLPIQFRTNASTHSQTQLPQYNTRRRFRLNCQLNVDIIHVQRKILLSVVHFKTLWHILNQQ